MTEYNFTKDPCDLAALEKQIRDSAISGTLDHSTRLGDQLSIFFDSALSPEDESLLGEVLEAHDGQPLPPVIINGLTLDPSQEAQLSTDDAARNFSNRLTAYLKVVNQQQGISLAQSLWAHHRLRALEITVTEGMAAAIPSVSALVGQTVIIDSMNLVISGDIETAYFVFAYATPDPMDQDFHAISTDLLAFLRHQIGVYLGWE